MTKTYLNGRHKIIKNEFSEFMKNTELGLCLLNRDFEIVWANKTETRWFGPLKKLCGKHCYKIFEHKNKICEGCPVLKTFQTGKPSHSEVRTGYTKSGKRKFYEISTSPIRHRNGRVDEVLEIVRDITYRKRLEDERARLLILERRSEKELLEKTGRLKLLNRRLWLTNSTIRENAEKLNRANEEIVLLNKSLESKVESRTKELKLANEELLTLYTLGKKMVSSLNLEEVLGMIVKTISMMMDAEASLVRLLDDDKRYLVLKASYGLSAGYKDKCRLLKLGAETEKLIENKVPFIATNIAENAKVPFQTDLINEGFRGVVMVPIVFNGETLGTIATVSRKHRAFVESEVDLLQAFASQAAIAIKNAKLHESVQMNYYNTINTLSLAMEARDPYTRGHAERVTGYSIAIAKTLKLPDEEMDILKYSGKVHDIGKIAISDLILLKPGRLTPAEKAQVELHPIKGVEIISNLRFLERGIPIIRHHHERYDGKGYPDGLKGEAIPLGARILSAADAFDAMTSERPYRNALMFEEAMDELKSNRAKQFDPQIVNTFLEILTGNLP